MAAQATVYGMNDPAKANALSPDKMQQLLDAKKEYETREAAGAGAQELMAIHARANNIRSEMGVAKNDTRFGEQTMATDVQKLVPQKTDTQVTPTPAPAAPTPTTSAPSTFTPPSAPAMSYGQAVGQVSNQVDPLYLRALENVRRQRSQDQLDTEQIAVARGGQHSGLAADAQTKVFNNAANNMSNIEADRQKQIADLAQMLVNRSEDNTYRDRMQSLQEWSANQNVGMQRDQFNRGTFESDRGYNYQTGRDQVGDSRFNQQFQYQQGRDQVGDSHWQQQLDVQKGQQEWDNQFKQGQFDYQKASDIWDRTFKDKSFDQSVKQFSQQMGLDWAKMDQSQQQFVADQAYKNKVFNWSKDSSNPDNMYKQTQIGNLNQGNNQRQFEGTVMGELSKFTNPDDVKGWLNANKQEITNNLGLDGYAQIEKYALGQYAPNAPNKNRADAINMAQKDVRWPSATTEQKANIVKEYEGLIG